MPLDLRHHPTRTAPGLRLVAEARVVAPHLVGRTAHRTLEQVTDAALKHRVGGQSDHTAVTFRFEEGIDLRQGESAIGAEVAPLHRVLVAGNDRLQHRAPSVRGVDVAERSAHRSRSPNWLKTNSGW